MAETAYERGAREGREGLQPGHPQSGGNILTKQYGPLPLWAWLGIATLIAIGYYLWRRNSTANSTSTTPSSDVPQFVNQTYTNVYPPADNDGGPPPKPRGDRDVKLPNFVGRPQEEVLLKLKDLGLMGHGQRAVRGKTRIVTAQNPKAGTTVEPGSIVTLTTKLEPAGKQHGGK